MNIRWHAVFVALLALNLLGCSLAGVKAAREKPHQAAAPGDFEQKIAKLDHRPGLLDLYVDDRQGKVFLSLPAVGEGGLVGEYLYVEGLVTGLGSNPVGLDRGQLGETKLVALRLLGGRLLVEEQNLRYRALSDDPGEVRATRQSFATSILWAGEVAARHEDGRSLVDFTSFILRDAHGVSRSLARAEQGAYSLDPQRSAVDLDSCLAFPDNLELEAVLTWAGSKPGSLVRQTAPSADSVSLVQHQSLIRLPEPGYEPRELDPRTGSFGVRFMDYAAPLDASVHRNWLVRHRLEKTDPGAERSTVKEPLVYYVDRGAPEPIRGALVEGASWWAEAFDKAGFIDAFRVELLPEDAHPLDVRYNVIQWVHRSTRGWSYGGGVADPRTGEMIKGHVSLGSLRVRQDRLLFEGLLGTGQSGSGSAEDPVELALARIRQLSAHEVGHTLGLAHNFAASTYGRASVMDYPAPLVTLGADGTLDVSEAYAVGLGAWDLHTVRYAYSQFAPGADRDAALTAIVEDGLESRLIYLSDPDARPAGAAHPLASLWDNGADPVAQLELELAVRDVALANFGPDRVLPGEPLARLEEVLASVYFRHRYQLTATAKMVGGVDYRYAVRGDGQPPPTAVPAARQRAALEAVLAVLEPERLDLPESVLATLHPRPADLDRNRELFRGGASPIFDPLAAAATAADAAVAALLVPERAARLIDQNRRDPELPGLDEVVGALVDRAFAATVDDPRQTVIASVVETVVVDRLIALAGGSAATEIRARAHRGLADVRDRLSAGAPTPVGDLLIAEIDRYRQSTRAATPSAGAPQPPPGQPIGSAGPDLDSCSWQPSAPTTGTQ